MLSGYKVLPLAACLGLFVITSIRAAFMFIMPMHIAWYGIKTASN